jgi:hypothetical protein
MLPQQLRLVIRIDNYLILLVSANEQIFVFSQRPLDANLIDNHL